MNSGVVKEDVELVVPPMSSASTGGGTQTLRSFDGATGSVTDSQVFAF